MSNRKGLMLPLIKLVDRLINYFYTLRPFVTPCNYLSQTRLHKSVLVFISTARNLKCDHAVSNSVIELYKQNQHDDHINRRVGNLRAPSYEKRKKFTFC